MSLSAHDVQATTQGSRIPIALYALTIDALPWAAALVTLAGLAIVLWSVRLEADTPTRTCVIAD